MTAPTGTPAEVFAAYTQWLERQPLAANTRRTYRVQAAQFCAHLATSLSGAGDPLREQHAATYAMRDYRTWLKAVRYLRHDARFTSCMMLGAARPLRPAT
jgi:hypothetical protein